MVMTNIEAIDIAAKADRQTLIIRVTFHQIARARYNNIRYL